MATTVCIGLRCFIGSQLHGGECYIIALCRLKQDGAEPNGVNLLPKKSTDDPENK